MQHRQCGKFRLDLDNLRKFYDLLETRLSIVLSYWFVLHDSEAGLTLINLCILFSLNFVFINDKNKFI